MSRRSKRGRAPIDHSRITDGFGEMIGRTHYEDRPARCGRCNKDFNFTAAAQKYVHEQRGVPIKRSASAGYCQDCANAQGSKNRARAQTTGLQEAIRRTKAAHDAQPKDAGKLLEYAVAKIRVLETAWSAKSAQRLVGELRRVHKLDPKLAGTRKWEARLHALIDANLEA